MASLRLQTLLFRKYHCEIKTFYLFTNSKNHALQCSRLSFPSVNLCRCSTCGKPCARANIADRSTINHTDTNFNECILVSEELSKLSNDWVLMYQRIALSAFIALSLKKKTYLSIQSITGSISAVGVNGPTLLDAHMSLHCFTMSPLLYR